MSRSVGWPYKREFQCHRCGNCCRGDGFVDMLPEDIARAAAHLGLSEPDFLAQYCHQKPGGVVHLRDQEDEQKSCIFLLPDDSCRIHPAKPDQCRGFPFAWRPRNAVEYCEGMRAVVGLPPLGEDRTMTPGREKRRQGEGDRRR